MSDISTSRAELGRVIDKIRKLFALGQSPNEHEAQAAVSKAQQMLEAYDLTMESIEDLKADSRTSIRKADKSERVGTEGKPDGWKADLFEVVAVTSDCYTAYENELEWSPSGKSQRMVKHAKLIGFGHDVEMAGYAFAFLVAEIERLAQAYADVMWAEIKAMMARGNLSHQEAEQEYVHEHGRHPLKAKLYWIKGATEAVCDGLRAAQIEREQEKARRAAEAEENGCMALVLDKRGAIRDFQYMERYGKTYDEQQAIWAAQREAWAKEAANNPAPAPAPCKPETEAQRRRREEREERENERYWERERARERREEAKKDRRAYRAGVEAGEQIRVKPGIKGGAGTKGVIG